jgi:hypothetical protein
MFHKITKRCNKIRLKAILKNLFFPEKEINRSRQHFKFNQSNLDAIALEMVKLEQELRKIKPAELDSIDQLRNLHVTSALCTQDQFMTPEYNFWCKQLKIDPVFHRKYWEWYIICQVLWENNKLAKHMQGCGFGVGTEPMVALFARFGCKIVATDAPTDAGNPKKWENANQFASSIGDLNTKGIASQEEFLENVSFQPVDMNFLPDTLKNFDFLWSSCALDHLGNISNGIKFIINSMRCLKPGGIAVYTTEYNISSNDATITSGETVLFRRKDIESLSQELKQNNCELLPVNFDPGSGVLDKIVSLPPWNMNPHLKLLESDYVITSIGLIILKH